MHGLGFNRFASKYLSSVKVDSGGTFPQVSTPWYINKFSAEYYAAFARTPGSAWPVIGGNEDAHAIDLFGRYDITWSGTLSHTSNGVLSDTTTGYGYIPKGSTPDLFPDQHRWCFGFYSVTNLASDSYAEMGSTYGSGRMAIRPRTAAGNIDGYLGNATLVSGAITSTLGLIWANRYKTLSTVRGSFYHNYTEKVASTLAASGIPGSNFAVCTAANWLYSARRQAFIFCAPINLKINQTTFYNLIQDLQTHLGRQV